MTKTARFPNVDRAVEATVECPTDDQLGALVEHALDPAEVAHISAHIDRCDGCRALVVAAVRGDMRTPSDVRLAHGTPSLPSIPETAVPLARPLAGTRMGRYEIRGLLGKGGMGEVFAAYDVELERTIALKVLRPELARAATVLADRLIRESRLMAKIAHPAVITVHDVGREGEAVFVAMELIRGETLAAFLARTQPSWRSVAAIYERAGQGLAAAHDAGIVHRDFKPDNVLVEGAGTRVVVTDFGIAMAAAADPEVTDVRLTQTGGVVGTPAYMAPEQLAGGTVDRRADVFAFTVSLWEALFGERPFRGSTVDGIRAAMRMPPKPSHGNVPRRLVRALERGLAIDPERRWPDMRALLRELAAVRSTERRTLAIAAAGGALLIGIGVVGALALGPSEPPDPCADAVADAARVARGVGDRLDTKAKKRLDDTIAGYRAAHAATCRRRDAAVASCLAARKTELDGFLEIAVRDGAKASPMASLVGDPLLCRDPRPGLAFARVPADPSLRDRVTEARYRGFAIEAARDHGAFATAIPDAKALYAEFKGTWPPSDAENLYLVATTQSLGGDTTAAIATLREAAALAERAHHGYIAANCWIQLIALAAFDEGEPQRALEYAGYADAALETIGRPADVEVLYLYYLGNALMEADRPAEAEDVVRRALEIATARAPQYAATARLGIGSFYEERGRYAEAASVYQQAIAELARADDRTSAQVAHERLAISLAHVGRASEAEAAAREAVRIADATLGADNGGRASVHATLAQVLHMNGDSEAALVEAHAAAVRYGELVGQRHSRYGEILSVEGMILVESEHYADAIKTLGRACEILAFGVGEHSTQHAECALSLGMAYEGLDRYREALAVTEPATDAIIAIDGDATPRAARALLQRGAIRGLAGKRGPAIGDLERAIVAHERLGDHEQTALAKYTLAIGLLPTDPSRAKALASDALALLANAARSYDWLVADIRHWLRTGRQASP